MNLSVFNSENLFDASNDFFKQLGISLNSNTSTSLSPKEVLKNFYKEKVLFESIKNLYFIGVINDSIFNDLSLYESNYNVNTALKEADNSYNGLMLFALELSITPTRSEISELTRVFNRISEKMPVALLLKYIKDEDIYISFSISERFKYLQNWRQGEKVGKVIILYNIKTTHTHSGHLRILLDLKKNDDVYNFNQLHKKWMEVFDVNILNKKFFKELSNWYFSALDEISFPDDLEKRKDVRNATNLIRLITRVIFIWFIKEKKLVPENLFNVNFLSKILKDFNKNKKSKNYYNAILQNLFFGTLNQKMDERKFAKDGKNVDINKEEYGVKNLFRYANLFNISENDVLNLFKDIPFLNGGLFDCLDKPNEKNKIEYVDGFSRNSSKKALVPDYLFFGAEREVDLNKIYDTRNKKYKARGLINLLESYKFTIAENTPIEEEIALDPELLGKVFENLLASFNPETQTTARKQTGSFYTPREIVSYMVDESLLEYLKQKLNNDSQEFDIKLRELFSYSENPNPFDNEKSNLLITAINDSKILDPACGSGAFPMGVLHKIVHILQKLDPENNYWKEIQKERIIGDQILKLKQDKKSIEGLSDTKVREKALEAVKQRLIELEEIFNKNYNFDDYSRKLYLIENCVYGIDIQPIAVQISKLRFFISLIIDQKVNKNLENLGVRSLPNLETKFVAANTLIGLDKPIQTIFRNSEIEKKESELKEIRHKYFIANTRREKINLQKQDKKLRSEIAKLLENDGWHRNVALNIASFDPYDQNTYANWFDSEWMFGLTTGFDIVIGNPPYIQLQKDRGKLANLYKDKNFKTFDRMGDIYSLFYEKGFNLLNDNGVLMYITSNKWMRSGYGEKTRKFFADNTNPKILIDFSSQKIFESATVDTNLLLISKSKNSEKTIASVINENSLNNLSVLVRQSHHIVSFKSSDNWVILSDIERRIKEKVEKYGVPLKDWDIKINRGILTGYNEAFIIDGKKKEELIRKDPKSDEIIRPILRGRDIKRYAYDFANLWLITTFPSLKLNIELFPAVKNHLLRFGYDRLKQTGEPGARKKTNNKWFETQDSISYWEEFYKQKIIYPCIISNEPTFILDENEFFTPAPGNIITGKHLKYLLAFLCSKLCYFSLRKFYMGGGIEGELKTNRLLLLPIPFPSNTLEIKIDKIIKEIYKNNNDNKSELYNEIDLMVYNIYNLNEIEINFINSHQYS